MSNYSEFNAVPSDEKTKPLTEALTWDDYKDSCVRILGEELVDAMHPEQGIRNHMTVLKEFKGVAKASATLYIRDEFTSDFQELVGRFAADQERKVSKSTVSSRLSLLKNLRAMYFTTLNSRGKQEGFREALRRCVGESGLDAPALAKKIGVPNRALSKWLRGKCLPRASSKVALGRLARIESFCGLRPGALVKGLPHLLHSRQALLSGQTAYGKKLSVLRKLPYILGELPTQVEEEFNVLVYLMSSPYVDGSLLRNSHWRADDDGTVPTAEVNKQHLKKYFGFLCLSPNNDDPKLRGLGFTTEQLSIALINDAERVLKYIDFRKCRAGNIYTSEVITFLQFCASLLRPETGFLAQNLHFSKRLPQPVDESGWVKLCESNRQRLLDVRDSLVKNKLVRQGREVYEPIMFILDQQHPLRELRLLADRLEASISSMRCSAGRRAVHERNLLLIRMLTANPLRIKHFSRMTWTPGNTGNLYQRSDGSWWLRFPARFFKNQKGAAKDDYNVPLVDSLAQYIVNYLQNHRIHLAGADECDYVFLPPKKTKGSQRGGLFMAMSTYALTHNVRLVTRRYLKCAGFGPHAFRHILVTDYLKNNHEGFEVAAKLLNDKPETVRKTYSWVKTADYFSCWNQYLKKSTSDEG